MTATVVVLSESALRPSDAAHIAAHVAALDDSALRGPAQRDAPQHDVATTRVEVLVPADTERHLVAELIDHLGLLELRAIWDDVVGHHPSAEQATFDAQAAVATSVRELERAGLSATGRVVADDPLPDLDKTITATHASELVVVTKPQMLEDTFHRDWAHRARERFGLPVLHFYTGTEFVGS